MRAAPTIVVNQLARIEYQIRRRLDRAANRLEDNDPIDVLGLRLGVKVLNVVDRAIDFRGQHREAVHYRAGGAPWGATRYPQHTRKSS